MKAELTPRRLVGLVSVASALTLTAGLANGATIAQLLANGGTQISDNSAEALYNSTVGWPWVGTNTGDDTTLDVGDDFIGFASWNTLENAGGEQNIGAGNGDNSTLSAIFANKMWWNGDLSAANSPPTVVGDAGFGVVTSTSGPGGIINNYDFIFEPVPAFATYWEGELAGLSAGDLDGAMVLFFENTEIDVTSTSIDDAIAELKTGELILALGFGEDDGGLNGWGTGATGDERWVALDAPEVVDGRNFSSGGLPLGNFAASLSVVYSAIDGEVAFDQVASDLAATLGATLVGNGDIDWNLAGAIKGSSDYDNVVAGFPGGSPSNANWVYVGNDNNATFAAEAPEPSMIALLGAGLLGGRLVSRRRRNKA